MIYDLNCGIALFLGKENALFLGKENALFLGIHMHFTVWLC